MTSPAPSTTSRSFISPGFITLTQPQSPRQFSRILHVIVQGLQPAENPHNSFAKFSIVHDSVVIYSATSSFSPNMITEMCLTKMPQNVAPVLDFPDGKSYQIHMHTPVPCNVKLRIQHT